MISSLRELFAIVREDYVAHRRDWTTPGFRAVATHRFGVWRMSVNSKLLRAPLSILYRWAFRRCRNVYGIELPYTVRLGRGVMIHHQGGIVIHGNTVIGDGCTIRQGCTLGIRSLDQLTMAPILGERVSLGAGSVVLGQVHIGNDAAIGANAVVLHDVPDNAIAVGNPARNIIRQPVTAPDRT